MKCPYQKKTDGTFAECTIECSACKYETKQETVIDGRKPHYMGTEAAIRNGYQWYTTKTTHKIVGCKYADGLVKPIDQNVTNINNSTKTSVVVHKSIF